MEKFIKLFDRSIRFAYHCFDRIVIRGYIIARMLEAQGVRFRMKENAFVSVGDPAALQAAADRIDPHCIQERLDHWTFMLGPKFAQHEREGMDLRRYHFISQIEHAQNIIFKRNHPIHSIFERSCDLGLARITTDRIANIFGWRITKRTQGKAQVVLDQMDHGHHVLRLPLSRQAFRIQRSEFRQDQGQAFPEH